MKVLFPTHEQPLNLRNPDNSLLNPITTTLTLRFFESYVYCDKRLDEKIKHLFVFLWEERFLQIDSDHLFIVKGRSRQLTKRTKDLGISNKKWIP